MALLLALFLFTVALVIYGACLGATTKALINSAKEIRTTADAERQIAAWRGRRLAEVIEEPPLPPALGGDLVIDVRVLNTVLPKLGTAQPVMAEMAIRTRGGKLLCVDLFFVNGPVTGVGITEWFAPDPSRRLHVSRRQRPWGGHVEFSSELPEPQRVKAFAFNADCLMKPWGRSRAEDVLPGIWEMDTVPQ